MGHGPLLKIARRKKVVPPWWCGVRVPSFFLPCLVCLESCFTAVGCSSPAHATQYTYLGCHRVVFSCVSRIPCLPRGGRQKVTHTHTHTHTHTCQPYAKINGWRSPRAARTHSDYLCHCRFLVTARYQYHLYREQNIVGPTWPGRRESRSLARWQLAR